MSWSSLWTLCLCVRNCCGEVNERSEVPALTLEKNEEGSHGDKENAEEEGGGKGEAASLSPGILFVFEFLGELWASV